MYKNHSKDVYGATYFLLIINRIMGTAPYVLTDPPNRKYQIKGLFIGDSVVKILLIFAFMVYTVKSVVEHAFIGNIKICASLFLGTISMLFIIFSILRAKYVILAFKILYKVDEKFKCLGVWMSYKELRKRINIHVIFMLIIFIAAAIIVYFVDVLLSEQGTTLYFTYLPQIMIFIVEVQYYNFLHMAMCRFRLLNEYLETLENDQSFFADSEKPNILEKTVRNRKLSAGFLKTANVLSTPYCILETVSDLHIQLVDMCTLFNKAFSMQLLFRVGLSLIIIIFSLFYFIVDFQNQYTADFENFNYALPILLLSSCLLSVVELYILARISDRTCQEANNCPLMLHNIKHACTDPEILDAIELYSIQMYHNKLQFNVCGLFPIDHTLLYSMTGAVTTYLIFLVQFSKSQVFMDLFLSANNLTSLKISPINGTNLTHI